MRNCLRPPTGYASRQIRAPLPRLDHAELLRRPTNARRQRVRAALHHSVAEPPRIATTSSRIRLTAHMTSAPAAEPKYSGRIAAHADLQSRWRQIELKAWPPGPPTNSQAAKRY